MERVLDIAAKRLKIDPAEIRRMNLVHSDEFPYRNAAGDVYDSGNYTKGFEMLLETMNYDKLRKEQGELRRKGVFLGIGLAGYVENTAASSKAMYSTDVAGYEKAVVRIDPTGHVVALVGTSDSGQGHLTAFAQIVADELGVNIDDVDVVEGDTALTPYGFGSWVSRSIITSGNALIIACQKLRSKVKRIAAFLLHVPEDGLTISEGVVRATGGDKGKEIPLAALAKIAYRMPGRLPHDEDPQLEEFGIFDPPGDRTIMSYGWHGAVIEVDPEMGSFEVKKYYVIHDAGVIVNPAGADGQFYGGVISQGMLQTFSELKYDRDGILLTTSLNDYIPPTSLVVPEEFKIGHLVTPGPGPGGFKGLSEGGVTGAPAAFVNAIADAISPLTSSELKRVPVSWDDVWNAIPHDRAMHISES
jgi:carbon-monoxide dehydrogenase large subunit